MSNQSHQDGNARAARPDLRGTARSYGCDGSDAVAARIGDALTFCRDLSTRMAP